MARGIVELSEQPSLAKVANRRKVVFPRSALAPALFFVLTCVMTNPLVLHIASAVEDKQDALLNTWIVGWVGHALLTDPLNLFNANIFYPYPNTLAFSETMLPQGLFALPFNLAFDNTVLGYNLVLLASFFLAAYAMYLLVLDLTHSRGAALVAGTIFAFNPFNLGNLAQVQLLSFGWLQLAMMYLRRMLRTKDAGRMLKDAPRVSSYVSRDVFLFSLFFSLQALSSFYYAFFAAFAVALYVVWDFLVHRPRWSALIRILVSAVIIAIIVVPFFLPYLAVQRDLGFQRSIEDNEPFSASLKLYATVSPQNALYSSLLALRPPVMIGGYPLDNLFPGVVALALGVVGLAATRIRERWFYFLILAFAFLLSLGPRLFLAPSLGTDLTLPYRWLYDAIPLMRAFRAPVRFDALVMFALAILAGFGFDAIRNSQFAARITNYELRFSALLVPLIALEYLALPAANITPVPTGDAIPQYVRWLAKQPSGGVLELPMIASDPTQPLDLTTQYLSTYHWHTTPDGYSGFIPPRRGEIAYEMQNFPDLRNIRLLQALDVQYIVIHGNPPEVRIPFMSWQDLQLVQQFGTDKIYRVQSYNPEIKIASAYLFLPQPAAPNQIYSTYLVINNSTGPLFATKPTDSLQIEARWQGTFEIKQQSRVTMPLVTSEMTVIPIRLMAPPLMGKWRLELSVSGRAIPTWDLSGDVSVEDGEPAHQVVIPSLLTSDGLLSSYAPGSVIKVLIGWLPSNKIDAYYSVSVRVVDPGGNKIAAVDRQPEPPTLLWRPDQWEADLFMLTLPHDIAPGEYTLQMKMYQADQGIDVLLVDWVNPNDVFQTITLGTFTVK